MREALPIIEPHLVISADQAFFTQQGEGPTMGEDAVFLRLQGCNLTCDFCDTKFTWLKKALRYCEKQKWTLSQTLQYILSECQDRCQRLVLTGGEPLLQQAALAELCGMSPLNTWNIEIETNGTIVPSAFKQIEEEGRLQINCSPKLSNAGMAPKKRLYPYVLQTLTSEFNTYLKFVVESEENIDEIVKDILPIVPDFPRNRIYISPEGVTVARLDKVLNTVRHKVQELGFTLGDRRHIRIHGNKPRT